MTKQLIYLVQSFGQYVGKTVKIALLLYGVGCELVMRLPLNTFLKSK